MGSTYVIINKSISKWINTHLKIIQRECIIYFCLFFSSVRDKLFKVFCCQHFKRLYLPLTWDLLNFPKMYFLSYTKPQSLKAITSNPCMHNTLKSFINWIWKEAEGYMASLKKEKKKIRTLTLFILYTCAIRIKDISFIFPFHSYFSPFL